MPTGLNVAHDGIKRSLSRLDQRSGVDARPEIEIEQREAEADEAQHQPAILDRGHIGGESGCGSQCEEQVFGIGPEVTVAKVLTRRARAREARAVFAELNDRCESGDVCADKRNGNPLPAGQSAPASADVREHR